MEPDFGSWQTPNISRSHLYRGTIAWTPPTAIYRAYTVLGKTVLTNKFILKLQTLQNSTLGLIFMALSIFRQYQLYVGMEMVIASSLNLFSMPSRVNAAVCVIPRWAMPRLPWPSCDIRPIGGPLSTLAAMLRSGCVDCTAWMELQ